MPPNTKPSAIYTAVFPVWRGSLSDVLRCHVEFHGPATAPRADQSPCDFLSRGRDRVPDTSTSHQSLLVCSPSAYRSRASKTWRYGGSSRVLTGNLPHRSGEHLCMQTSSGSSTRSPAPRLCGCAMSNSLVDQNHALKHTARKCYFEYLCRVRFKPVLGFLPNVPVLGVRLLQILRPIPGKRWRHGYRTLRTRIKRRASVWRAGSADGRRAAGGAAGFAKQASRQGGRAAVGSTSGVHPAAGYGD